MFTCEKEARRPVGGCRIIGCACGSSRATGESRKRSINSAKPCQLHQREQRRRGHHRQDIDMHRRGRLLQEAGLPCGLKQAVSATASRGCGLAAWVSTCLQPSITDLTDFPALDTRPRVALKLIHESRQVPGDRRRKTSMGGEVACRSYGLVGSKTRPYSWRAKFTNA